MTDVLTDLFSWPRIISSRSWVDTDSRYSVLYSKGSEKNSHDSQVVGEEGCIVGDVAGKEEEEEEEDDEEEEELKPSQYFLSSRLQ